MGTTNILDLNNILTKVEKGNVAQNSYTSLKNKPKINSHILTGDKTSSDLGLADAGDITDINTAIGDMSDLGTTATNLVDAINEVDGKTIVDPTVETLTLKTEAETIVNLFNNAKVTKWGKLVIVDFDIRINSAPSSDLVICDYVFPTSKSELRVTGQVTPENASGKGLAVRIDERTHKLTIKGGDANIVYFVRLVYITT